MTATQMVLPLHAPGVSIVPDLSTYDRILVAFSGGKDSICCLLRLLDLGVPRDRIELHHHLVDGGRSLFDWPVTESYCRKFAQAFDLPIYMSWLEGGLEREMCRKDQPKAPTHFETPDGEQISGGQGNPGKDCGSQDSLVFFLPENRRIEYCHYQSIPVQPFPNSGGNW